MTKTTNHNKLVVLPAESYPACFPQMVLPTLSAVTLFLVGVFLLVTSGVGFAATMVSDDTPAPVIVNHTTLGTADLDPLGSEFVHQYRP